MKKLIKLMLALMLMLTVVPTSSWQVFATVGEETITIENKPEENTGNFSSEPTTTPEVTVVPESTPEITATPDVAPTPEVTPTGTPEVTVGKTTLVTIHQYIENDQVVNKEVIIEDLEIGQTIQAKDYALSIDGQTVVSTSNDSLLLQRSDNVIVYEYEIINSGQLLSYGSVIAGSSSNKKARSAKVGNDEPGAVFTTKQARWVDENSGIAAIDFTVKGNPVITGSDVLLIVDNSASMTNAGEDRWTPLQDSVKSFVNELYADVNGHTSTNKIGLLAFSSNADSYTDGFAGVNDLISVNAGGSAGKYSAKEYYNNILWNILSPYGNSTNYEVAFESAVKMFTDLDSDRPKFVIFLSDGVPNAGDYETAKMYSNQLKTSGVKVFSLGLRLAGEKPFNEFIEPLASNPTSQYAKDIQDLSQLQSIYRELAGQIKIAGTDAIITDYINSEIFEIASKPDSNVNYEASHGTVLIEGNKVVWNIGDITESEKKLTIYVKVSNVNASGLVYTNTSANNTYVDYANSSQTKDIPNASLTIGNKGSIQMNYYLVDKNGKLISQTGAPLDDFSKRVVLETEMFEKNGSSSLDFGTYHPYPPTTIVVDNVTYVYVASGEYNTSIDKVIILNPANKTENVYYGYKEYTVPNFIFYVQHYLENEDGSFTKQEMSSKYETPSVEGEILYAKNYVNEGYLTNYTFVENHKDSISQIENKINSQNNLLTVYYTRIMDNIEYKVNHVVNGKSTIDTVKGTIWRGESQKTIEVTSDSLKAKTDKDYAGYKIESIKDGKGNDVKFGDKVPNGTIITINYIKDETQTKDIHYTVKHVAGTQEINDDFTVTVQVLETKAPVQPITAKTIIGYKVVQSDIDNAPTTVAEGEVITINYVKDETQTKEVSYEVTHKLPNGDSEVVTVKETVWINDADELKVTAESIATKAPEGYKINTIQTTGGETVVAGDIVANKTKIEVTYVKDETQTKDIHYTVKHVAGTQEINDDFTVTVQVLETKAPVQAIIAKTIIGYKVVQSDIDNAPTTVAEGEVITINYVKDETQTKEVSYEVTHKLPNGDSEVVTVKETVWINDADELKVTAESIATKAPEGYKINTIKTAGGETVVAGDTVANKTKIEVTYIKDETQTKDIHYTVKHVAGTQEINDDFTVTVQVLETKAPVQPITAKTITGYKVVQSDIDNAPTTVAEGEVITINYVKDETQTKEVSYEVTHKLPNGDSEVVTVKETVWINDADELKVTAESIATKAPEGYKINTIQTTGGETVVAGDIVANKTKIEVTYVKDETQTKDIHYTVKHVAGTQEINDDFTVTVQVLETKAPVQAITAKTIIGYKVVQSDIDNAPTTVAEGEVITINYVKDETQTKEVSYEVTHKLPNGDSEVVTVKETVWINDADELKVTAESIATKAPEGYKINTIQTTGGETVVAGDIVANKTKIEVTYVKDETQTKDIHYTVKHVAGTQEINDDFTVTVQVLETKAPVQAITAKTIIGYKVVQSDIDNAPTTVAEGEVITINYVKDETQTKEVSYEVTHKLPNGDSEVVTVKETVWINDADELKVTAESIATKAPEGYKINTIQTTGGETVVAGDIVANKTKIEVTYLPIDYEYVVKHHMINADGSIVEFVGSDDHETHIASFNSKVKATDHKVNIIDYKYWYAEQDEITMQISNNVLNLFYYQDVVGDRDQDGNDIGDEIPDVYQVKFIYKVETNGTGYVTSDNKSETYEYVTKDYDRNEKYDPEILNIKVSPLAKDVVNNAASNYRFNNWHDSENKLFNSIDEIRNSEYAATMVFTVVFNKIPPTVDPEEPVDPGCPVGTTWNEGTQLCEEPPVIVNPIVPPVNPNPPTNGGNATIDQEETPLVKPTPTPSTTPDITEVEDDATPEIVGKSSWALINLIAVIIGLLLTIILIVSKHESDEEDDSDEINPNQEETELYERKRIYKVIGAIVAVISVIIFILTENMTLPMVLVDKYTIIMLILTLVTIVVFFLGRKWHEVEMDEEVKPQV